MWRIGVEAWGGHPFPPQGHWCAAVSNGGAVRTSNSRSDGGPRHGRPQPAQPVEGHGGHLHEAQREPGRQPRLHSPTHRVLTVAFPAAFVTSHFASLCLQLYSRLLYYTAIVLTAAAASLPSVVSFFSLITPVRRHNIPVHDNPASFTVVNDFNSWIQSLGNNLYALLNLITLKYSEFKKKIFFRLCCGDRNLGEHY